MMKNSATQSIYLARGAHCFVPIRQRTLILVKQGSVYLRPPPEWPAYLFAGELRRVDAEEAYAATANGYAELAAISSAEIMLIEEERQRLFDKVTVVIQGWIRTIRLLRRSA